MKNFILQSLDGKINISAKKVSIVGTFTPTQTEKSNQFANELSQLMETTFSHNVSEIESLQDAKLNILSTLPDSEIVGSEKKQQKNPLLKAFENRNITLNNGSEIPEVLSPQSKQNLLISDQSLFVDNISYKAITEDGKNDKLESVLKSKVGVEDNRQLNVSVSENIILSAMAQQLLTNIITEKNPQPQDYRQLDIKMEDNTKPLISNQNTTKMELKSEPLTDNSALLASPAQNTIINNQIKSVMIEQNSIQIETKSKSLTENGSLSIPPTKNTIIDDQIKPIITDQNSIQTKIKSEPLVDNNIPIIPIISIIQKEVLKANDGEFITNGKSMLQYEGKPQFHREQNIDLSIHQIQPIKPNDNKTNLIQDKNANSITDKISLDTQFISINKENTVDTKQENIENPKEQVTFRSRLFANQEYIKESEMENYSVVSSNILATEKVLLISYPIKLKQDTIQKPIDSVKSIINPGDSQPSTSNDIPDNTSLHVSVDTPEMNELPNAKQSESRQVIGSFQRSQVISNDLESSYIKETESSKYSNNLQLDTPIATLDKENKPIEQYELRQNISPIQNSNIQIKLSPKQVYDGTPEIYNPADISALKAPIMESENDFASVIGQAELNDNNVENNLHGKFLNPPSPFFQRGNNSISIEEEDKMDLVSTQNSLQTKLINEFADNLTSRKSETIAENNNISENKPIKQEQYTESKRNTQKTPKVIDITNKSNTKSTEMIPDTKNIPFDNLSELRQNDITVQNKLPKIENELNQFSDQPKNDNALENAPITKSNKNDLRGISQVERKNINELISEAQAQIRPDVKIANNELPQTDKIINNSQIDIPIELSKESKGHESPQIEQERNVQTDLRTNINASQKTNSDQLLLMDNPIILQTKEKNNIHTDSLMDDLVVPQTKQERNIQASSHINGSIDQKLNSDKPISTEEPVNKPVTNLPPKSLENAIINNVDDRYEQDILPPISDRKASESKSDINQTIKTQIITNGLLFNKSESQSNNKNTQDQQRSMINQTPIRDNQIQKTNNQKDFSAELDETHKYNTEKPNSQKPIKNQNVKIDERQPDDYVQEKPVQISSNTIAEPDKSSKPNSQKNLENNPYIAASDTSSKQETKDNILQEKQQIGYDKRLNIENNRPIGKVDNIEANNFITKNDVIKDKSSEINSPKIVNVKESNTDKTIEKIEIPLSKVNNDFVSTQKADVRNIPVADKNEITSKVVELPDKITQYINTAKNDTKPQSVMIQLEPVNLGKIKLKVSVKDNKLMAEMSVASFAAKEIIEAQLPDIRRSLMQYDLQVSGFNVTLDNGFSKFGSSNPNSSQQDKWSSESWNYNRGDGNNNNNREHTKRYMRYVNNNSMVDILT